MITPINLITKSQWDKLLPYSQGFLSYTQGSFPGSELKELTCPYPARTKEAKDFAAGEFEAMMEAQGDNNEA